MNSFTRYLISKWFFKDTNSAILTRKLGEEWQWWIIVKMDSLHCAKAWIKFNLKIILRLFIFFYISLKKISLVHVSSIKGTIDCFRLCSATGSLISLWLLLSCNYLFLSLNYSICYKPCNYFVSIEIGWIRNT